MRVTTRPAIRSTASAAAAAALLLAGCGGSGDDPNPSAASVAAPADRAAASTGPEARTDLGVVSLDARIGRVGQRSAGVVIDAERGLIVTTAHTLWGAHSLKVATGLGVLHGRILARDACDDLAVVEIQPRVPGLVAMPTGGGEPIAGQAMQSAFRAAGAQADAPLSTQPVVVGEAVAKALGPVAGAAGALTLDGPLPRTASGAPLLAPDGRLGGLAIVLADRPRTRRAALPWTVVDTRMDELRSGDRSVYVGWREHYRCAGAMHAYAAAAYPGFRRVDAVLNAAVPASRLPGTGGVD